MPILSNNDGLVLLRTMPQEVKIPVRTPHMPVFHSKPADILELMKDHDVILKSDGRDRVVWCGVVPREVKFHRPVSSVTTTGTKEHTQHHERHCRQWHKRVKTQRPPSDGAA